MGTMRIIILGVLAGLVLGLAPGHAVAGVAWCDDDHVNLDAQVPGIVFYAGEDQAEKIVKDTCLLDASGKPSGLLEQWTCDGSQPVKISPNFDCASIQKQCIGNACGMPPTGVDLDGDEIPNKLDNCPLIPNPADIGIGIQSDLDGDGYGDPCDLCPKHPSSNNNDSDGDGLGDACDNCIFVKNPNQEPSANDKTIGAACYEQITAPCSLDTEDVFTTAGKKDYCVIDGQITKLMERKCAGQDLVYVPASGDGVDCAQIYGECWSCMNAACAKGPNCKPTIPDPPPSSDGGDGGGDDGGGSGPMYNCEQPNPAWPDANGDGIPDLCQPGDYNPNGGGGDWGFDAGGSSGESCPSPNTSNAIIPSLSTGNLYAVSGGPGRMWIAGEGGHVAFRKTGEHWQPYPSPWETTGLSAGTLAQPRRDITALWTSADGLHTVATTDSGFVFRWDKDAAVAWTQVGPSSDGDKKIFGGSSSGKGQAYYGVHGISAGDYWIVGSNGAIWHLGRTGKWSYVSGGMQVTKPAPAPNAPLRATNNLLPPAAFAKTTWRAVYDAGAKRSVWIVGDEGKVIRREWGKSQWVAVPLVGAGDPAPDLRSVWVDPKQNQVVVGGSQGTMWCGWNELKPCWQGSPEVTVLRIAGASIEQLYAVGTHSTLLRKIGAAWTAAPLPFPNSVTGLWSSSSGKNVLAVGINGVVYETGTDKPLTHTLLMTGTQGPNVDHIANTHTRTAWRAYARTALFGETFVVVGDDLAIAERSDDGGVYTWALHFSDETVFPFLTTPAPFHDWYDLYRDAITGTSYIAGAAEFIVAGQGNSWQGIPLPLVNGTSRVVRTIRGAADGTIVLARDGDLLQLQGTSLTPIFPKSFSGTAAAHIHEGTVWAALRDGMYRQTVAQWDMQFWPASPLAPRDVQAVNVPGGVLAAVIAADEETGGNCNAPTPPASPKFPFGGMGLPSKAAAPTENVACADTASTLGLSPSSPPQHLLTYNTHPDWTGGWQILPGPGSGKSMWRLHPFSIVLKRPEFDFSDFDIDVVEEPVQGMVVLGELGLIAAPMMGTWFEVQTNSTETWHAGDYQFFSDAGGDVGLTSGYGWGSWDLHTIGVGSHNAIQRTHVHFYCKQSCELDWDFSVDCETSGE